MNESLVSSRYTKALFNLGIEKQILDALKADIEYIYTVYRSSEPFKALLQNPVLKPGQKINIIREAFQSLNEVTLSFIDSLIHNRREELLPFIAVSFIDKYNRYKGIETVTITTSTILSEENLNKIKSLLAEKIKKEIVIQQQEDPSLIGGFILRIDDKQIDASIRSRLNKIRQNLLNTQLLK